MGTTLFVLSVLLYLFVFLGLKIYYSYPHDSVQNTHMESILVCGGVVLATCLLKAFYPLAISNVFLGILSLCVFTAILLEQLKPTKITLLAQYLLCFIGVSCFNFSAEFSWLELGKIGIVSLFGFISWRLFIFFNKIPFISFVLAMAWGLGLLCSTFVTHFVPLNILLLVLLVSVSLMALNRWNVSQGYFILSKNMASFVGFLWGGLLSYFLFQGFVLTAFSFWAYYVLEGIFLVGAFATHCPLNSYLETVLSQVQNKSKPLKIIFFHILLLTLLSTMPLFNSISIAGIVCIFVLMDLYLKLGGLIKPSPTWREIFKESKQAVTCLVEQLQKTSLKRVPVKKKTKKKSPKKVQKQGKRKK